MAKFGIQLPTFDPIRTGERRPIVQAAKLMEDHGFDQIWTGDHLWCPAPHLDAVTSIAAAAAVTDTIALGFSVMLLGLHHQAWTAKQLTTIDQLAPGRELTLGVGVGGEFDREFELAGVPMNRRGKLLDDALEGLPALLTTELSPPISKLPTIYVGGRGEPALQRAARIGEAWMPIWVSPDRIRRSKVQLAELAAEHGRPAPKVALVVGATVDDDEARARDHAERYSQGQYGMSYDQVAKWTPVGSAERVAEALAELVDAGVDELVLMTLSPDPLEQITRLAEVRDLLA